MSSEVLPSVSVDECPYERGKERETQSFLMAECVSLDSPAAGSLHSPEGLWEESVLCELLERLSRRFHRVLKKSCF